MTDQEIVEGLKIGAPDAFRELYANLGSAVLTYLVRLTGKTEMAEDLAQETFLMVIRKIGFFRPLPGGGLRAWVFRVATHLAIDVLRRENKMEASDDMNEIAEGRPDPEQTLDRLLFSDALHLALESLSGPQKMFILLKEQEGMSCLEISRVCGCSENAVKQGLFRARAALRRKLCR
jgi:RNA polymerase sigma-70 factor, ECF subfamily